MRLQFGSFSYEWPEEGLSFSNAKALCLDCTDAQRESSQLIGSVMIGPAASDFLVADIRGKLVSLCGDHHYNRDRSKGEAPHKHAVFWIVVDENRVLGETNPVPSTDTAHGVVFNIKDETLRIKFGERWREFNDSFRRFWRT